jgi:hypothetical protein
MGRVKKAWVILLLIGAPLLSAQDVEQSATAPQRKGEADTVSAEAGPVALHESLVIAPGEREKLGESIFFRLPEEGRSKQPESKTFASEFRKEINSIALTLPDLSASWFGFSWYVRNPLRYKLSPGSTYEHQFGLSSGKWVLSVDGIGMTSLENLDVALQYPFGKNMSLYFRYNDMQYKLRIQATGKLPWE